MDEHPGLFNAATSRYKNNGNSDKGYIISPPSPCHLTDIEIQEYKVEPCANEGGASKDLSIFNKPSRIHIPMPVLKIKTPIVVLERCDKIWETLKLIKDVQDEDPLDATDIYTKEETREQLLEKPKQHTTYIKQNNESTLNSEKTSVPLLQFSVKKTKKVFPCAMCGKQYMEKRSLRNHSVRIHGIVIPLERHYNSSRLNEKKDFNKAITLFSVANEKFDSHRNGYKETAVISNKISTTNYLGRTRNTNIFDNNPNNNIIGKSEVELFPIRTKFANTKVSQAQSLSVKQSVKCTLCGQKVTSIRKHLINYHKIEGGSPNMLKQLESSLFIKNKEPSEDKKKLRNILAGTVVQQSINGYMQGKFHTAVANKVHETSQAKRKRKYLSSYLNAKKRYKSDNEHRTSVQNAPAIAQEEDPDLTSFKCDICLGIYASVNSYQKHRRIHRRRGETKENFHKFKCRYHNSPLNKRYKSSGEIVSLSTSRNSINADLQLNNSKHHTLLDKNNKTLEINEIDKYNEMNKNKGTTCICGRSFRHHHTLLSHQKQCKLCRQEDIITEQPVKTNGDINSGIDITITIKKRNDSYEIVDKNNSDNELKESESESSQNGNISNIINHVNEERIDTSLKTQHINISESSKYSRNHSILKLQSAEEDTIIDIEDDVQHDIKNEKVKKDEIITQINNKKHIRDGQDNEIKKIINEETSYKVHTLKEMCHEILDRFVKIQT